MAGSVMQTYVGLAVFGVGITLLIVALDALGASTAAVFKVAGLSQPDSPWLLGGGIIAVVAGLILAFRGSRKA
jgi:hypothetical protein